MQIYVSPIGVINSQFESCEKGARQASIDGKQGTLVVKQEYLDGLAGLEDFSHIIALYYFHLQSKVHLKAKPCFDPDVEHGIFASRYPTRPNHLGISILTLERIEKNILYCKDVDVLNNTPLLDIKPYVKQFDRMDNTKCGWYDSLCWQSI